MAAGTSLVWLRNDLRIDDHPALQAAIDRGGPIVAVFIFAPDEDGDWPIGSASRWWLHHSLGCLEQELKQRGNRLILRRGPSLATLHALVRETGASAVYWNRRYEPATVARDATIKAALRDAGVLAQSFNGSLLFEPWDIRITNGTPFKVFTPFWRKCLSTGEPTAPAKCPGHLPAPSRWPTSVALQEFSLEPSLPWDGGMREAWRPGTTGANAELQRFLHDALVDYHDDRDRPDHNGTSRLSPYLHFGELSPRQIWHAVRQVTQKRSKAGESIAEPYLRQLVWREFAHHLLYHFPETPLNPLRDEFANFPWEESPGFQKAWERGRTGFPYIDAGMRQLWSTGWMHNRVRMAVASFLVKDLLIPWQVGARWFWDTLVDADLANNTLGWQWTAGCGADAAPYFRVFNPVAQGEKFDPKGDYIRKWVPELSSVPDKYLHEPWKAPQAELRRAGVRLGESYPLPIVDHAAARVRALEALEHIKRRRL